ncbi:ERF family protein [Lactobacillus sp. IBH004]|uniref:ERF family protein n=1 Tax=Lactobacillus sp. IBH004 TaxID=2879107 RepID=UPI00224341E9|nr:ERF family protein [Lactobacillus sp. IBH004]UZN41868.1 ERF family protein [Lactobacillus sp. IBH004]
MEFIGDEQSRAIWNQHFIQVKSQIKQPRRTHTVKVVTQKGRNYSYKYADLADVDKAVMDACRQVKDKDGNAAFAYYFDIANSSQGVWVQTVMVDTSGAQMITNKVWFSNTKSEDAQKTASLISYAKRYSLSAAFGIASEDDDDAQSLKPQDNRRRVMVLDVDELNSFKVNVLGKSYLLKDIWNDYLEYKDPETLHWLMDQKDPQTLQAIKQFNDQYKMKKILDQAKEKKAKKANETKPADKTETGTSKDIETEKNDEIKKLVDGDTTDDETQTLNLF